VLGTIDGPPAEVLAFSGDGTRLAIESGVESGAGNIAVVDVTTRRPVAPPVKLGSPATIGLNEDGTRLAAATVDDARLIDVATGETLGTPQPAGCYPISFAFSSDGSLMGALCACGVVWLFDTATGERTAPDIRVPFSAAPVGLGFTTDDTTLLVGGTGGQLAALDLVGRQKLARPVDANGWIATFSPDGTRFAIPINGSDNDTAIVDVATGKRLQTLHPARQFPNWDYSKTGPLEAAFSPDGREVAIGSAAYDGQPAEIEVFSVADGRSVRRLPVPGVPHIGVPLAWSPDGRVLAAGVKDRVLRIDAVSGAPLPDLALPDLHFVLELQYDKDGTLAVGGAANGGFGKAWVFDSSGQPIRGYGSPTESYLHLAWGPGGTLILQNVASGENRVVDLVADQQVGSSFAGPTGSAKVAAVSDGRGGLRGVVAGDTIELWDVETGQPIGTPIRANSFSTNGKIAVSSDPEHNRMMIWDLDPAVWRVRACEAAGRNLTRDEWTKFLPEGEPYHVTCPQYPAGA